MSENLDKLAKMIAHLQSYIEQRALEIAKPRIAEVQESFEAMVNNIMAKAAAEEQRLSDLVTELRRQVDAQVRRAERAETAIGRVRALDGRSSMGRVYDYVPLAEIRAALDASGGER